MKFSFCMCYCCRKTKTTSCVVVVQLYRIEFSLIQLAVSITHHNARKIRVYVIYDTVYQGTARVRHIKRRRLRNGWYYLFVVVMLTVADGLRWNNTRNASLCAQPQHTHTHKHGILYCILIIYKNILLYNFVVIQTRGI